MAYNRSTSGLRRLFDVRRLVSDRIKRMIDYRIQEKVRLDHLSELFSRVDRLDHEVRPDRIAGLERRFDDVERIQRWSHGELERIVPQIAAQESQLEALRQKIAAVPAADQPQIDEARSLIDEIRREHSQIRARLTAVAQYEDRLRKLEDRSE